MRLELPSETHLVYCSNIHPGESWAEIRGNLERYLPEVKARVAPARSFGVGLRLSGIAAHELAAPAARDELRAILAAHDLYLVTINGFPYGPFHGTRVKEEVYRPDWLEDERVAYTLRLAELMAELVDERVSEGTISTVPGAFRERLRGSAGEAELARRLLACVAALARIRDETGKTIALALEPEPRCHLETVAETIAFFERHLLTTDSLASLDLADPEAHVRRHLGVCLDACHMAVEFEDVPQAVAALRRAGIRVPKCQISAGLEVPDGPLEPALSELARFDDRVYLHQVVIEGDPPERFVDLPEAMAHARARGALGGRWRVHCHVPLFHADLGLFASTRDEAAALVRAVLDAGAHLEVETYTWDVLPPELRAMDIRDAIAAELVWTLDRCAR